jgi:tryptophan-rich sensory protein
VIQLAHGSKKPILIAFLLAIAVGGIGGAVTEIGTWYTSLIKPSWQPPDWAFGPIWTLIYITTGIAGVRAWRLGDARQRRMFLIALLINCVLNVVWSLLFFKMQRPDLALIEVVALWLSIVPLIVLPLRYSPRSSLLLLPYLAWVSVAAYLNLTIVRLNPIL